MSQTVRGCYTDLPSLGRCPRDGIARYHKGPAIVVIGSLGCLLNCRVPTTLRFLLPLLRGFLRKNILLFFKGPALVALLPSNSLIVLTLRSSGLLILLGLTLSFLPRMFFGSTPFSLLGDHLSVIPRNVGCFTIEVVLRSLLFLFLLWLLDFFELRSSRQVGLAIRRNSNNSCAR